MTASKKLDYRHYRKLKIRDTFKSDKFPIAYADGRIGGTFSSYVTISCGDMNNKRGLTKSPPEHTHFGIDGALHWKDDSERVVGEIFLDEVEAVRRFDELTDEIIKNTPSPNQVWGTILFEAKHEVHDDFYKAIISGNWIVSYSMIDGLEGMSVEPISRKDELMKYFVDVADYLKRF